MQAHRGMARRLGAAIVVLTAASTLGGCVHVSKRAWDNGRGLSLGEMRYGPKAAMNSFEAQRLRQSSANPQSFWSAAPRPYAPFRHW